MVFGDLINYCRLVAFENVLNPSEDSIYRGLCRAYSQKFSVPLPQVYLLDPEHVMTEVYESELDEVDLEKHADSILEEIYSLEDPEYYKEKESELQSFIEMAEEEEEERLKAGRPIHKNIKKALLETTLPPERIEPPRPTKGKVDFSHLSKDEES